MLPISRLGFFHRVLLTNCWKNIEALTQSCQNNNGGWVLHQRLRQTFPQHQGQVGVVGYLFFYIHYVLVSKVSLVSVDAAVRVVPLNSDELRKVIYAHLSILTQSSSDPQALFYESL